MVYFHFFQNKIALNLKHPKLEIKKQKETFCCLIDHLPIHIVKSSKKYHPPVT